MKKCTKCGQTKPLEEFPKFSRGKLGRNSLCKVCHYEGVKEYQKRKAPPDPTITHITCVSCGETKPVADFYKRKHNKTGYEGRCKACISASRKVRWVEKDREKYSSRILANQRMAKYGLTPEQYAELTRGDCEICGRHVTKMCIDHTTNGSYHGVLCDNCNKGIGNLQHDPEILEAAAAYVRRTRRG